MKIVDAVWEKRNLGVTCYEITFDARDSLDEIKARWDELTDRQYLVFKVPPKRADIVAFIQSRGFRFIEAAMTFTCDLRNWKLNEEFKPFCEQCSYAPMNDDDIEFMFAEIKKGIFKTDRIYLDPYFTHEQAAQRYVNWAKDLIARGIIPYKVMYQGEAVGFFVTYPPPPSDTLNKRKFTGILDGVYSRFEGTGTGILVSYVNLKRVLDEKEYNFEGVVSGNNQPVLNCITALGHEFKSMHYVFVKHTDTKSTVQTKVIELMKDIRPEFDFAAGKNFIDDGTPDSFDVVALVAAMQKEFGVSIKGRDITPENFSTLDNITALLKRYGVRDEV